MWISDSPPAVHLRGEPLKACDSFKYLGAVQSKDTSSRGAIKQRMGQASVAFNQLKKIWRAPMKLAVKGLLYCTTIRCILLYGAGAWTTLEEDFRLLETFDMGCVRHIQNVSRLEHIRSSELRARLGIDCSIREEVTRARLRLFGHVTRMGEDRLPQILVDYCFKLKHKKVGKPRKCWVHCIADDMASRGFGPHSGAHLARKSKEGYRNRIVYNLK